MICEMAVRLSDKDYGDTTRNIKAGDVIVLKTEEQIKAKFSELLTKGLLTQEMVDKYTNLKKNVKLVDAEDFILADCRWPWSDAERKGYLIVKMNLTLAEIEDLSRADGYLTPEYDFIQTAYRKKQIKLDSLKAIVDTVRLMDPDDDYQPLETSATDKSYIELSRDPTITKEAVDIRTAK